MLLSTKTRSIYFLIQFSASFLIASPFFLGSSAKAVVREWDGGGTTAVWSDAANWTGDAIPAPVDLVSIGSLTGAFDDVVLFDFGGKSVRSLDLVNGADFDTVSGRLVASKGINIGHGEGLGATQSELIVRPRNGNSIPSINSNVMTLGTHGQVTMLGGQIDVDGTGVQKGILDVVAGGSLFGYGLLDLTDSDESLAATTTLLVNDGVITVGDPLPGTGGPAAPVLHISAPNSPLFGQVDLGGSSGGGVVSVQQNSTLILEAPILGDDGAISNSGVVRFRSGGEITGLTLTTLNSGAVYNEGTSLLNFQGGNTYSTPLFNSGVLGVVGQTGDATVAFESFTQTDSGTLVIDLGGTLSGQSDAISVQGDATLDGTLDIDLAAGFVPVLGNSFEILTSPSGVITGQFDSISFPTNAGLVFDVLYNAKSVVLNVVASTGGLNGDFDQDLDVDGADFLRWQRGESPAPFSATDLSKWETNFGSASLNAISTAVPEPTTVVLLAIGMASSILLDRRRDRI